MESSKLVDTLKSLTRDEYRWLRDFLRSPYFNKHTGVSALGAYLLQLAQGGFPTDGLVREHVHRQLFPATPYRESAFNHLMSRLLKCVERFLSLREFEADEEAQLCYTLEAMRKRQLHKNFSTHSRAAERFTRLARPQDYLRRYQLSKVAQQRFSDQEKRAEDPHLQDTSDWLDLFYLSEKLKLQCSMVARHQVTNETFRLGFVTEQPEQWPGKAREQGLPQLYLSSLRMLQADGNIHLLEAFMAQIHQRAMDLTKAEIRELYNHAAFYCTQHIRKGRADFAPLLLRLYKEGIEQAYLLDRGTLSPWVYKNITKLGLGLKQYEWVQWFIENYSQHLPREHQEDALNFSRADLHYYRGEHKEAMLLLHEVEFSDTFYKLGSKEMLIKIYVEQQETEALLAMLNSFRIMLLREQSINQHIKSAYLNFLRLCRDIYKLRLNPEPARRMKLEQKITTTNSLTSRKWLLEQLAS